MEGDEVLSAMAQSHFNLQHLLAESLAKEPIDDPKDSLLIEGNQYLKITIKEDEEGERE
tara:strand:+ start:161 stop:337 length:177 start_codon:yes stop_codon:yes gene_type:complete